MTRAMQPAAFLDRDGTIIVERDYLGDPDGVVLESGAAEGLRALAGAGFRLIVVSNQSGVARGRLTIAQVERVNARVAELLAVEGVTIAGWYFCPHGPDDGCNCRKPLPGLIDQATAQWPTDLDRSVVIGDKDSDVLAGVARGVPGYLVLTGHGCEHAEWANRHGHEAHKDIRSVSEIVGAGQVALEVDPHWPPMQHGTS